MLNMKICSLDKMGLYPSFLVYFSLHNIVNWDKNAWQKLILYLSNANNHFFEVCYISISWIDEMQF